jgi:heme-degrading monooxygenase HmoA
MKYVLINHKVEDYNKWKSDFDKGKTMLKDMGAKSSFIFRTEEDPNHLFVLTQWENLEKAKNFAESNDLRTTMKKAGVTGQIQINFLEEIERTTY